MTRADEECRLIGAILPQGVAGEVLRRLREEKGIDRACVGGARGLQNLLQFAPTETGDVVPVEILNVVVPAARADELFEFVFETARVDRPEGGIVFQHTLSGAMPFVLPELPEEQ
jgi:hypothetical protein